MARRRRPNSSGNPSRIVLLADRKASGTVLDEFTSGVYPSDVPIRIVRLTRRAEKQIRTVPRHIKNNLLAWITAVELGGLGAVRKSSGFHDEPLHGRRAGQRSIRLSRSYRAIYQVVDEAVRCVSVEEVTKHRY